MLWLLANWKLVLVGSLMAALALYAGLMRLQRDSLNAEYASYRAKVSQEAEAAAKAALEKTIADEHRKQEADRENSDALATLARTVGELRRAADNRSSVPAAPAGSKCPDGQACFDRTELERALRGYREGVRGLVDEGSAVTIDLNSAKRWAQSPQP